MKYRPRLVCRTNLAAILTALIAAPAMATGSGTNSATAGPNSSTVPYPGFASQSHSYSEPSGVNVTSSAFGSPAGLHASASTTGWSFQYGSGATFTTIEDTTFNYQSDYQGGQLDWVQVQLSASLSGTITGQGLGGTGSGRARIDLSGPIYNEPNGTLIGGISADTGDVGGSVRSFNDSQTINVNESLSTGFWWVRRGEPISMSVSLSTQVFSDKQNLNLGTVTANFSDSLRLDPYEVFEIATPGITANSPSLGIVNNQIPAAIPEPTSLALLGLGMLAMVRRRRV